MRPRVIVLLEPGAQSLVTESRASVGPGVGPLTLEGLDEAFGLAVGPGRVGTGPQVADSELVAELGVVSRDVRRAVVGHDLLDVNALASEPGDGSTEEADGGLASFVGQDLDVGEACGVIDADVCELPTDAA